MTWINACMRSCLLSGPRYLPTGMSYSLVSSVPLCCEIPRRFFVGHCWSNESYYPAITRSPDGQEVDLHPSFAPKCTHAYALNPRSARRLLEHFTFPLFAYSRALDQAMAWLVQSKRINAFSLVPSLIVQHKESSSDISHGSDGMGSGWKERLEHGMLSL